MYSISIYIYSDLTHEARPLRDTSAQTCSWSKKIPYGCHVLIVCDAVEAVYRLQYNWNLRLINFTSVLDWNNKLQRIFFGWILFQNWFVLHWTLLDNTANYTHHVKSVFTIQSFWRISELSAEWTGRPNNSLKSTMLGEELWKHKDFSSSRTFTVLEPKPMLCNSCTTNSEPPLLWCISAANTKSKVLYLVLQTWLVLDQ